MGFFDMLFRLTGGETCPECGSCEIEELYYCGYCTKCGHNWQITPPSEDKPTSRKEEER